MSVFHQIQGSELYDFKNVICITRRRGISTTAISNEAILSKTLGRQEMSF
jgi:hypothetical protein